MRQKAWGGWLVLPLFLFLSLFALPAAAVAGGAALGMSGTFAGRTLTLAQGQELASGDLYVVVFNAGAQKLTVEMGAAAPPEVSVEFSEQRFTLLPGQQKKVGVRVKVGRYAWPDTHKLEVIARQIPGLTTGQVAAAVAVAQEATLKVLPGPPVSFADIKGHWAQKDIEIMARLGVARGVAAGSFRPNNPVTRAEFAVLVLRALGIAEKRPEQGHFRDVPANAWYYGAVETVYAENLAGGYGDGTFRPQQSITREEMAVMVVRALVRGGKPVTGEECEALLQSFSDWMVISPWARQAACAAQKTGIIAGRDGRFAPKEKATRAEAVVMLKRLLVNLGRITE